MSEGLCRLQAAKVILSLSKETFACLGCGKLFPNRLLGKNYFSPFEHRLDQVGPKTIAQVAIVGNVQHDQVGRPSHSQTPCLAPPADGIGRVECGSR